MRNEYEEKAYQQGYQVIIGLDEAGRGCMAGPLVVGGVIFPRDFYDERINDSKQLTYKQREKLLTIIKENALYMEAYIVDVETVDQLNVYRASQMGMEKIIEECPLSIDYALTDAMPLHQIKHESIIKGDSQSISIAAASIVAKVTRDHLMEEYAKQYPNYEFEKHKGYCTKRHKELLKQYGITPIHRKSFKPVQDIIQTQISIFDEN